MSPKSMALDIVVEDPRWKNLEDIAQRTGDALSDRLKLEDGCEVTILASDDARIEALNAAHRSRHAATNVLSWPSAERGTERPGALPDPPEPDFPGEAPFLGDIALAYETCKAEAEAGNRAFSAHVTHLILHGMLHLLGFDHVREEDAVLMEGLEVAILEQLGLPDPYE